MESNDEKIWPVLNSIVTCNRFEHVREYILQPLTELLNADSGIYIEIDRKNNATSAVNRSFSYGRKTNVIDQYVNDFYNEDPLIFPATKIEFAIQLNDIQKVQLKGEGGQLGKLDKRTRYYKQFIEANHLEDVLGIIFPLGVGENKFACIGVHKYSYQQPANESPLFKAEDYIRFERLIRPLGVAFNHIHYKNISSELKTLISILEDRHKQTHYILFNEYFIPHTTSCDITHEHYSLLLSKSNIKNIQFTSKKMRKLMQQQALNQTSEMLYLDGFGQTQLYVSKEVSGEINHLLIWENNTHQTSYQIDNVSKMDSLAELTIREKDVIKQIIVGKSNKNIACDLNISIRTVENHLRSIYEKLGVHTRTQLIHTVHDQFR